MEFPHVSVLLDECMQAFDGRQLRIFIDGTLGAGGHASQVLQLHPEIENFLGFDQDPQARAIAQKRLESWQKQVTIVPKNFHFLSQELNARGITQVDGILLDLGVSSMQMDTPERGFSIMREGPLDMRMDPTESLTAGEIINTWSEQEMTRIFREFGEEPKARHAARTIVRAREKGPIATTTELTKILQPIFWDKKRNIHPLTLIFQALRIAVNRELEVLESVMDQAIALLAPGGRLAVITFQSLEDRIVKNKLRDAASDKENTSGIGGLFLDKEPILNLLTRKPIIPSDEEVHQNPRSRSAKLRIAEKR